MLAGWHGVRLRPIGAADSCFSERPPRCEARTGVNPKAGGFTRSGHGFETLSIRFARARPCLAVSLDAGAFGSPIEADHSGGVVAVARCRSESGGIGSRTGTSAARGSLGALVGTHVLWVVLVVSASGLFSSAASRIGGAVLRYVGSRGPQWPKVLRDRIGGNSFFSRRIRTNLPAYVGQRSGAGPQPSTESDHDHASNLASAAYAPGPGDGPRHRQSRPRFRAGHGSAGP